MNPEGRARDERTPPGPSGRFANTDAARWAVIETPVVAVSVVDHTRMRLVSLILGIGVEGELQSLARLPFGKWWGYPALGYTLQHKSARIELALLPSLGGMSVRPDSMDLSEPFWLRERLRARLWHVGFDVEHGRRGLAGAAAGYWQATLCSSSGRIPLIACTSAVLFGRTALQLGPTTEVSVAVGFGGLYDEIRSPPRDR